MSILLVLMVGCASVVSESSSNSIAPSTSTSAQPADQLSFASQLETKGVSVISTSVTSQPVLGLTLTAQASDGYGAVIVESRIYHEAALAKARSTFPWVALNCTITDPKGATLAQDGGAIDPITLPVARSEITDEQATLVVEQYLKAYPLHGLTMTSVDVVAEAGERTLKLTLESDNTTTAKNSLTNLILGSTSSYNWVGDLNNKQGLGLVWLQIRVTYPAGLADSFSVIDVARHAESTYAGGRVPDFASGPSPSSSQSP